MQTYYSERGLDALRVAIASAHIPDVKGQIAYARNRFGEGSGPDAILTKSTVGGLESSPAWISETSELALSIASRTAFDRLRGRRVVDVGVPVTRTATAAVASVVGEGRAIPCSPLAFHWETPVPVKVAALIVVSKDALMRGGASTLKVINAALESAVATATDNAFLSDLSGSNATHLSGSGTFTTDVATAVGNFTGDLTQASFVADPKTAAIAGQHYDTAGVDGGSLLGIPLLVTTGAPVDTDGRGTLGLIDGSRIAMIDDGLEIRVSFDGTIEQRTDPAAHIQVPTGVTTNALTSLFQADAAAIRVVRRIGWLAAEGTLVLVSGVY